MPASSALRRSSFSSSERSIARRRRGLEALAALDGEPLAGPAGSRTMRGVRTIEQVDLAPVGVGALERPAEDRDVAQPGHLGLVVVLHVGEDPADHHGLAVAHVDGVLDLAVGRGRARASCRSPASAGHDLADLLEDVQANGVALADLRGHAQGHADVLARDVLRGLEGVVRDRSWCRPPAGARSAPGCSGRRRSRLPSCRR